MTQKCSIKKEGKKITQRNVLNNKLDLVGTLYKGRQLRIQSSFLILWKKKILFMETGAASPSVLMLGDP